MIENRSWLTTYRGTLGIIAGKSNASMHWEKPLIELGFDLPDPLPIGCLLGLVDLVDIIPFSPELARESLFAEGPYCWMLANPRPLSSPVPMLGSLGLSRPVALPKMESLAST